MTKENIVKHYPQYVDGLMQKEKLNQIVNKLIEVI